MKFMSIIYLVTGGGGQNLLCLNSELLVYDTFIENPLIVLKFDKILHIYNTYIKSLQRKFLSIKFGNSI